MTRRKRACAVNIDYQWRKPQGFKGGSDEHLHKDRLAHFIRNGGGDAINSCAIEVTITVPSPNVSATVLQDSFTTGETSDPMAPSTVEWRDDSGINTGRNVLAGADYLL